MSIIALGNDLLRVERIARMGARNGAALLQRLLTGEEQALVQSPNGAPDWRRVAACVASKEAFFKALGSGLVAPLRWVDVAIGGSLAAPHLTVIGAASSSCVALGATSCWLTLSVDDVFILATVILADCEEDWPATIARLAAPFGSERPDPDNTAMYSRGTRPWAGRAPAQPLFWSDHA
jgi:holo-[acyl-carrier protein] synthase